MMLLYDKPCCRVYYLDNIKAVMLDWGKQMATHDEFTEACEFSLTLLEEKKVKKMIAENSKVTVVSIENQDWLTNQWFPKALEKGFRYSAVVVTNDAFVKFAVKRIENNINNELFIVEYFDSTDKAKEWLSGIAQ